MPKLKQITCSIELGPGNTPLKEFGAKYYDGAVETYIAVTESDIPFSIHLCAQGYIAPALAMYVFIDGIYQCNRNKSVGSVLFGSATDPSTSNTEFRVRQKEDKLPDGTYVGRAWTFAKLGKASANAAAANRNFQRNVGTIEVVVLRCEYEEDSVPRMRSSQVTRAPLIKASADKASAAKPGSVKAASVKPASNAGSGSYLLHGALMGPFDGACEYNLDGPTDWGGGHSGPANYGHGNYQQYPFASQPPQSQMPNAGVQGMPFSQPLPYQMYSTLQQQVPTFSNGVVPSPFPSNGQAYTRSTDPQEIMKEQMFQLEKLRQMYASCGINVDVIKRELQHDEALRLIDFNRPSLADYEYLHKVKQGRHYRATEDRSRDKSSNRQKSQRPRTGSSGNRNSRNRNGDPQQASGGDGGSKQSSGSSSVQNHGFQGFQAGGADGQDNWQGANDNTDWNIVGGQQQDNSWDKEEDNKPDEWNNGVPQGNQAANDDTWNQPLDGNAAGGWSGENVRDNQGDKGWDNNDWNNNGDGGQGKGRNSKVGSARHFARDTGNEGASWAARSSAAQGYIKSYWAEWDKTARNPTALAAGHTKQHIPREVYIYPAAPRPALAANPKAEADYGVQAGRGALYGHKDRQPTYMDTMQAPYAVFTFRYRSKTKLEEILGRNIDADVDGVVEQAEKDQYLVMSKEKLVQQLMQMKRGGGGGGDEKTARDDDDIKPSDSASQTGGTRHVSIAEASGNDNDTAWTTDSKKRGRNNATSNKAGGTGATASAKAVQNAGFQPDGGGTTGGIKW